MKPPVAVEESAGHCTGVFKNWPAFFGLSVGTVLTITGILTEIAGFSTTQVLNLTDPVLGFPFRYLTLTIGTAELFVAFLCLFTSKSTLSFALVACLSIDFLVYRAGLWTMGFQHSSGFVIGSVGVSIKTADAIMNLLFLYLLFGSCAALYRNTFLPDSFQNNTADTIKISCPACGGHIKFSIHNLGQKASCPHCQNEIILHKDIKIKMLCFFCTEHIEFPSHAVGEKISCPHCKMGITLKEPA